MILDVVAGVGGVDVDDNNFDVKEEGSSDFWDDFESKIEWG